MKRITLAFLFCLSLIVATSAQQGMGPGPGLGKPPGGGGGSDFVTATFTVGSDTNLESYTGEVGTWSVHPSYSGTVLVNAALDRIYLNTSAAGGYLASGTPPSANYCVQADFFRVTQMSINVSLVLAFDATTDTGILLRGNDNGTVFQWEVFDRVNGSNSSVVSSGTNTPTVGGAAVTMEMCRSGTSITVKSNTVQDTNLNFTTGITATGQAGLRFSAQASSTTGIHVDNFSAR